jgi:predicted Zn-dependent peptidase
MKVREEHGLAYMVRAATSEYQDLGNFMIQSGLDKSRIQPALKVIREEVEKLKSEKVDEQELQRAKDYMQGKGSIALENTSSLAQWYAEKESLQNKIITPEERFAQIQAITADDVRRVANDLFDMKKSTLAIIGPFKDASEFEGVID